MNHIKTPKTAKKAHGKKKVHNKRAAHLHTAAPRAKATTTATAMITKPLQKIQKKKFSTDAETAPLPEGLPPSKRKSPIFDFINYYANDPVVEEDKEKIGQFLEPIGLGSYKDKFNSFEQMIFTRTPILKRDFGMSVKERRLLRRKANHFRVGHFYKTGEIFQAKYPNRQPVSPRQYHRDDSSDDELAFILPAKDGIYKAHLRYPGATFRENRLLKTHEEDWHYRPRDEYDPDDVVLPHDEKKIKALYEKHNIELKELNKDGQIPLRHFFDAMDGTAV